MTPEDLTAMTEGVNALETLIGSIVDMSINQHRKMMDGGFGQEAADAGGVEILRSGLGIMMAATANAASDV